MTQNALGMQFQSLVGTKPKTGTMAPFTNIFSSTPNPSNPENQAKPTNPYVPNSVNPQNSVTNTVSTNSNKAQVIE